MPSTGHDGVAASRCYRTILWCLLHPVVPVDEAVLIRGVWCGPAADVFCAAPSLVQLFSMWGCRGVGVCCRAVVWCLSTRRG